MKLGLGRWSADILVTLVVAVVVASPALFTRSGFYVDWTNDLWLVAIQQHAISSGLIPSYYLDAHGLGVFYPIYMFYGGPLFAIVGGIAALLGGDVVAAYVGFIVLSAAAAYGGLLWLARPLGVPAGVAHHPPAHLRPTAYYIVV